MVLMLTVGQWADMFHVLVCFLGEAACLIPTGDLLNAKENVSMARELFLSFFPHVPKLKNTSLYIKLTLSFSRVHQKFTETKHREETTGGI